MESLVTSVISTLINFMKNCTVWRSVSLWDFSIGVFIIEGIMLAFRVGMRKYSEKKEE